MGSLRGLFSWWHTRRALHSPDQRGLRHITEEAWREEEREEKEKEREGGLYKCLANLNSKKTVNTISGTDSSHLVKKLLSQILTVKNNDYINDEKQTGWWWRFSGIWMCLSVSVCKVYAWCKGKEVGDGWGEQSGVRIDSSVSSFVSRG